MARKTKAEAQKTRQKILKAALDLFVEKGYERATFEDVAARIRLTKGAVYWHFKSKPVLFAALVADMTARHHEHVASLLPSPVSLDGLVAHFSERAQLIVSQPLNRKYFQMMLSVDWPAAKFISVKQRLRQLETGPFVILEKTLAALQKAGAVKPEADIATAGAVLSAMWLGLMKLKIDQCLEVDLPKAIDVGFRTVLDTIRA